MWFDLVLTQVVDRLQFANLDDQMHDFHSLSYKSCVFLFSYHISSGEYLEVHFLVSLLYGLQKIYIYTHIKVQVKWWSQMWL